MPSVEAVNNVAGSRGVGTADNELLSAAELSFSVFSPFRTFLEANTAPTDSPAITPSLVRSTAEASQRSLEDSSRGEVPLELLALFLNMIAPGMVNLSSGSNSSASPSGMFTGSASQAPATRITATPSTTITPFDGGMPPPANPAQLPSTGSSTDNGIITPQQREAAIIAPTATTGNLLSVRTEMVPEGPAHANPNATTRVSPLIPALAPIVSNLLPPVGVSGEVVLEVPEPVDAVEVQVGLPSTQIGDRPSAAGNRIAALAEMGAQLASLSSAESSQFVHQFQHLHPHLRDILSGIAQAQNQPTLDERLGVDATVANQEMNTPGTAWTTLGMHSTRILIPDSATALSSPILSGKLVPEGGVAEQTLTAIQAHLHQLNKEGQAEFRLHLHPPELGPLRIHLSLREGEIHGQLYVSDDTLRRLLQDQIPELRQRLEALGLNPGQWDIATDSRGSQPDSAWSSGQQVETSPRWWNEPPNYKPVVTNTPEPPGSASADSLEPNRVDVMV